ncbi:cellulose biosynthesis protein BcsG [Escherichia coli]|uniref:cellulose biosynthesis protein BcsG n=1 Tax=Escherichia coli TaxID=562 RepID=UPI003D809A8A
MISLARLSPNVPVGVKFFGMKAPHQGAPIVIEQPSSFLAISDLVFAVLDGKIFTEDNVDWKKLTSGLPQTATGLRELKCSSYSIPG